MPKADGPTEEPDSNSRRSRSRLQPVASYNSSSDNSFKTVIHRFERVPFTGSSKTGKGEPTEAQQPDRNSQKPTDLRSGLRDL